VKLRVLGENVMNAKYRQQISIVNDYLLETETRHTH